jgi:hypothetical protein
LTFFFHFKGCSLPSSTAKGFAYLQLCPRTMTSASDLDLAALTRRQLQAEAKKHGVKANLASDEIIRQLLALSSESDNASLPSSPDASNKESEEAREEQTDAGSGEAQSAPEDEEEPPAAAVTNKESSNASDLSRRLSKLSERIDRARLSLVSVVAEAGDSDDEEEVPGKDSLDEELGLDFSPPKTTVLLPATPKDKSRRPSGVGFGNPTATEGALSAKKPVLQSVPSQAMASKSDMYGAPQAATTIARPWTPSQLQFRASPPASPSAASPGILSSTGSSILKSAEYLRLRAERSERKRRRIEGIEEGAEPAPPSSSSAHASSAAAESTLSFCKRIAGMCQEVASVVTPHKNLALSSQLQVRS